MESADTVLFYTIIDITRWKIDESARGEEHDETINYGGVYLVYAAHKYLW